MTRPQHFLWHKSLPLIIFQHCAAKQNPALGVINAALASVLLMHGQGHNHWDSSVNSLCAFFLIGLTLPAESVFTTRFKFQVAKSFSLWHLFSKIWFMSSFVGSVHAPKPCLNCNTVILILRCWRRSLTVQSSLRFPLL